MLRIHRLAILTLLPGMLAGQGLPASATAKRVVDSLALDYVTSRQAPGVAIAVLRGTDTISIVAFGKANLELDVPATPRTVYRIGSVTKQFTAAAVLQLIEQDRIRLQDSIGAHLAGLPEAWRPVTILQLLNHTSGIPSYTGLGEEWQKRWGEEMTPGTIIAMVGDRPMDFAPGTSWSYNNTGYILLGMLIEHVTGRSWGDDLAIRFAGPLGMSDTRNCLGTPLIPRRASGYQQESGEWANAAYLAMSQPYSAGAMCSTVGDLARWNRALHTGGVVSAASYERMVTPVGAAGVKPRYGFALMLDTIAGRELITHGGGIHGFVAANGWLPEAELSVTVLTNSGGGSPDRLMKQIIRASLGAPLDRTTTVPLSESERDSYVGVYLLMLPPGPMEFTIAADGNGLAAQLVGQNPIPIKHLGNHTFGADFDPSVRIVFTMVDGRAVKVTLRQDGGTFDGERRP